MLHLAVFCYLWSSCPSEGGPSEQQELKQSPLRPAACDVNCSGGASNTMCPLALQWPELQGAMWTAVVGLATTACPLALQWRLISTVTRLCQLILLQGSRVVKQQAARYIKYPYGMLAYLSFLSPPLLLSSTYALKEFIKKIIQMLRPEFPRLLHLFRIVLSLSVCMQRL